MAEKKKTVYYFCLGTEAELIKMYSVIRHFQERKVPFKIVSTGQNDIRNSIMLKHLGISRIDKVLCEKAVYQSPAGLLSWWLKTFFKALVYLQSEALTNRGIRSCLVVHGDTVTTAMGAIAGRLGGMFVAHVEAGYRSSNLFHPFPEELDRAVASMFSHVLFCPYDSIGKRYATKKEAVNTGYNTSIDSLNLALKIPDTLRLNTKLKGKKYFIFALHRQETLINTALVRSMIDILTNLDTDLYCVFAFHNPTFKVLKDLNLLSELENNKKIITSPRLPYFEYIHLLDKSEFIMTDGVGNQQETYYLGKPCLILRSVVEGSEGMKGNAVLSMKDPAIIADFVKNYRKFKRPPLKYKQSPSAVIADYLIGLSN